MKTIILFLIVSPMAIAKPGGSKFPYGKLSPFTTDLCSAWPDGSPTDPTKWAHCCVAHDKTYWVGGSFKARENADVALFKCVSKTGEPVMAGIMLFGVRIGGSPFTLAPFRWGYGWAKVRGYSLLNKNEKEEVKRLSADPATIVEREVNEQLYSTDPRDVEDLELHR